MSTISVFDLAEGLQGLGVADEDAGSGAAACADHDCHGGSEAEGARASDDQDRDRVHEGVREAGLRADTGTRRRRWRRRRG